MTIKSAFHDIELIQHYCEEPNNGRMLWVVDVKINGELVTERYFGNWNRTDMPSFYESDSPDGRFFFIPREGGGFVIDTQRNFQPISFHCTGLSAATFIGNLYSDTWLALLHSREVILFNLLTLTQTAVDFSAVSLRGARFLSPTLLEVRYVARASTQEETTLLAL